MANVVIRTVQAATGATNRQDLRAVAAGALAGDGTTPAALAGVAFDATGENPLSTRAAASLVFTTADENGTGKSALPALASRRWFLLENQSDDTDIWWCFGTSVVAGTAFRLRAGGRITFSGDLPNDAIRVICSAGQSAVVVAQQC